jgi:hypothetical protein
MNSDISDNLGDVVVRFDEKGDNVFFPKVGLCFHKNFQKRFVNKTISVARRSLKDYFAKSQQNDIIHYLKTKRIIKN